MCNFNSRKTPQNEVVTGLNILFKDRTSSDGQTVWTSVVKKSVLGSRFDVRLLS